MNNNLALGTVYKIPSDLRSALVVNSKAKIAWNDITPFARNERICWIEFAKKIETRKRRISRTIKDLSEGKRRPCCWAGRVRR